ADVMMISSRGDEQRTRELLNYVKARNAMIRRCGLAHVGHLVMHLSQTRLGFEALEWPAVTLRLRQQALEIEWICRHLHLPVAPGPFAAWTVAINLNAIAIGVREVDRLADRVVGGT